MQQHHNAHLREVPQVVPSSPVDGIAATHTYFSMNEWFEGEPEATIGDDGMLNVRPTGRPGPYVSLSVARWRQLNAVVEAAISEAGAA